MKRLEIHAHSDYSNIRLLDSTNKVKDLVQTANDLGLAGITLTDHELLGGHVDFLQAYKELKQKEKIRSDFRIAFGNEIYLTRSRDKTKIKKYPHHILIAKDKIGYEIMRKLSSWSWVNSYFDRGMERVPTLQSELKEEVSKAKGHLISTTACIGGTLGLLWRAITDSESSPEMALAAEAEIKRFVEFQLDLFGEDFYLEIAPSKMKDQIAYNAFIKKLSRQFGIKIVVGTDSHYLRPKDRLIHKSYLNSKDGEREVDDFYSSAYLMDNDELMEFFEGHFSREEVEDFIRNSLEILNKIEDFDLKGDPIIPEEEVEELEIEPELYTEALKYENLSYFIDSNDPQDRYWIGRNLNALKRKNLLKKEYLERLEIEADVIRFQNKSLSNSLTSYFNTMAKDVDMFWECGSIVGPGRGSAGGFLTDYLMDITQLDPIVNDLPWWRFLNKERTELPKILGSIKWVNCIYRCLFIK